MSETNTSIELWYGIMVFNDGRIVHLKSETVAAIDG